ncbi:MAG TPA: hypothetical protein VIY47_12350, partial [Ignavibacteriaceae bacterium]
MYKNFNTVGDFSAHISILSGNLESFGLNKEGSGLRNDYVDHLYYYFSKFAEEAKSTNSNSNNFLGFMSLMMGPLQSYLDENKINGFLSYIREKGTASDEDILFLLQYGTVDDQRDSLKGLLAKSEGRYDYSYRFQRFLKMIQALPSDSPLNDESFSIFAEAPIMEDNFLSKVAEFRLGTSETAKMLKRFEKNAGTELYDHVVYAFSVAEVGFNGSSTFFPKMVAADVSFDLAKVTLDVLKRREDYCYKTVINNVSKFLSVEGEDDEKAKIARQSWKFQKADLENVIE